MSADGPLYHKYNVDRTDGSSGGKHWGCKYFVLDVTHDPAARKALQAYVLAIYQTHPKLAQSMIDEYGLA